MIAHIPLVKSARIHRCEIKLARLRPYANACQPSP